MAKMIFSATGLILFSMTWFSCFTVLIPSFFTCPSSATRPSDPYAADAPLREFSSQPAVSRNSTGNLRDDTDAQVRSDEVETLGRLSERSPTNYKGCVDNGKCLLASISAQSLPQSIYTDYAQVQASGWQPYKGVGWGVNCDSMVNFFEWDKNDFHMFAAVYPQSWIPDGDTTWLATYNIYVNPVVGAITIPYVQSPRPPYVKPGDPPPNPDLPLLTKLSDFVWLAYKQACGTDAQCLGRLEWVVHHQISHDVSKTVIQKVTGKKKNYPGFPGMSYEMTKDKGRALVGCPNGYGVAYMLAQHSKTALGAKTIDKAYVFTDNGNAKSDWVNVAYHITGITPARRDLPSQQGLPDLRINPLIDQQGYNDTDSHIL